MRFSDIQKQMPKDQAKNSGSVAATMLRNLNSRRMKKFINWRKAKVKKYLTAHGVAIEGFVEKESSNL